MARSTPRNHDWRQTRHGRVRWAALLGGAVALAACGGGDDEVAEPPTESQIQIITQDEVFACPDVSVVAEVAEIQRYAGGLRDVSALAAQVVVGNFRGGCEYTEDSVEVAMTVDFDATRGPQFQGEPIPFEYFVAIVDGANRILAKEVFPSVVEIEDDAGRGRVVEELVQRIPLERMALGPSYQILLGFQVSQAELQALRAAGEQ